MIYEKIENIKTPVKVGDFYLVPCLIWPLSSYMALSTIAELKVKGYYQKSLIPITPFINHPHNDKENGQNHLHVHADTRFLGSTTYKKYCFVPQMRMPWPIPHQYIILPVVDTKEKYPTPTHLIKKSKLKHNCIYKNKCPHRGYDLSAVQEENGIITCPLHGLQFDAQTKQLIRNDHQS